jgi:chorismate mutase
MSDQLERLLADLELELSEIDSELERMMDRRVELIFRRMDVTHAINNIKKTNGADHIG